MQQRYGTHLTTRNIRRVWAAISVNPRASKQELGRTLQLSYGAVAGALRLLNDAGYITFDRHTKRAVTVIVPFVITKRNT